MSKDNDPKKAISKARKLIGDLEGTMEHFEARTLRAKQRLAKEDQERPRGTHLYVGLSTINLSVPEYFLGGDQTPIAVVREVQEPPGEIELARALQNQELFGYIARYAQSISHELIVRIANDNPQAALNLAWAITSLLRIRSLREFLAPAYSTVPWSAIAAISDNTCVVGFLDESPKATRFSDPPKFTKRDFDWVEENLKNWFKVWEIDSFRLAAESYHSYHHYPNQRLMVAQLWSGIEALFDIHGELRFRLSIVIASLLEPRGQKRILRFKRLTKLYDLRSRIVHGANVKVSEIQDHIVEVSEILGQLLVICVEVGAVWSRDNLNDAIMS